MVVSIGLILTRFIMSTNDNTSCTKEIYACHKHKRDLVTNKNVVHMYYFLNEMFLFCTN